MLVSLSDQLSKVLSSLVNETVLAGVDFSLFSLQISLDNSAAAFSGILVSSSQNLQGFFRM